MNTDDYRAMFIPLIDYLKEVGCDKQSHSNGIRSLLHHLVSVSVLLSERGSSDELCKAGLFHSIYGTAVFKPKMVSLEDRDKIRKLIGQWSEKLVYEFCILPKNRKAGIIKLEDGPLRNDLIDLACANRDEQRIWEEKNNDSVT